MNELSNTVKVNAALDVTFEVDPVLFGEDPKKAIEKAVLSGSYDFEGTGDVYDFSIQELHANGVPFTPEYQALHGNPAHADRLEYSLTHEATETLNYKKGVSL